jgi:acyl dehydratase
MNHWKMKKLNIGDELPEFVIKPINRATLALYAQASGDHNPIHLDQNHAKNFGLSDVIAHGMLVMSYLGQAITNQVKQSSIMEYGVKFSSMTRIGDILTCKGSIVNVRQTDTGKLLKIELKVFDQNNDEKLIGFSKIALSKS